MTSVSTSYDVAMDAIRDEIEAYCDANGIDSEDFLSNLDGNLTASVFNDPTFQAYFENAYMQLVELLDPELINSLEAQVGDVDFDTLYAAADDDFNEFIIQLIEDDPELMALYAMQSGGESESEFVMNLLGELYANADADGGGSDDYCITQDARDLANTYNMGGGFDWVINQEDMFSACEMSILDQLSSYDQAITELAAQLESGEISESYFEAEMQNIYFGREALMGMLQQVTDQKMTFFEMISEMYNKASEMQNSIVNNMRAF